MTHLDLIKNPRRVFLDAQGPACQLGTLHLGDALEAVGIIKKKRISSMTLTAAD